MLKAKILLAVASNIMFAVRKEYIINSPLLIIPPTYHSVVTSVTFQIITNIFPVVIDNHAVVKNIFMLLLIITPLLTHCTTLLTTMTHYTACSLLHVFFFFLRTLPFLSVPCLRHPLRWSATCLWRQTEVNILFWYFNVSPINFFPSLNKHERAYKGIWTGADLKY